MRAGLVNRQGLTEVYGQVLPTPAAFILKEFIHAACAGLPCPSNRTMAEKYGAEGRTWGHWHVGTLQERGLIEIELLGKHGAQRRQATILFAPFAGFQTLGVTGQDELRADDAAGAGRATPMNDQEIPLQRAARTEPCFKCGGARSCSCARPALIHTRVGGFLPNIDRGY